MVVELLISILFGGGGRFWICAGWGIHCTFSGQITV